MFTMSAGEPPRFVAAVREMDRTMRALPPLARGRMSRRRPRAHIAEAVPATPETSAPGLKTTAMADAAGGRA